MESYFANTVIDKKLRVLKIVDSSIRDTDLPFILGQFTNPAQHALVELELSAFSIYNEDEEDVTDQNLTKIFEKITYGNWHRNNRCVNLTFDCEACESLPESLLRVAKFIDS